MMKDLTVGFKQKTETFHPRDGVGSGRVGSGRVGSGRVDSGLVGLGQSGRLVV